METLFAQFILDFWQHEYPAEANRLKAAKHLERAAEAAAKYAIGEVLELLDKGFSWEQAYELAAIRWMRPPQTSAAEGTGHAAA